MTVTTEEAENAVKVILEYIENSGSGREGLKDTPARVVSSWGELFSGYDLKPAEVLDSTFNAEGYDSIFSFFSSYSHSPSPLITLPCL